MKNLQTFDSARDWDQIEAYASTISGALVYWENPRLEATSDDAKKIVLDYYKTDDVTFPYNPIMYKKWLTIVDVDNNKVNEGKEYLETEDQFGTFHSNTYQEYARRIVLTIASNYKIKNPDIIFAPAKSSQPLPGPIENQEDLDKFLESIKANNV